MPDCENHPGIQAGETCTSCGRPYCSSCLTDFLARRYCGPCRDLALAQLQGAGPAAPRPPSFTDHLIPASNPKALSGYYFGIFSLIPCAGLALGPAALILGVLGLQARRENPALPGQAHAVTAVILGTLTTLANWGFVVVTLLARLFYR